ncbi:hypothetical protein KY284_036501 [Solanum tuberosum]|nr:hypothetical protein KY284_036501 [Solanum tuberosum]
MDLKKSKKVSWASGPNIFQARNSKSFNGEISDPNDIVNKSLFDFHEYENASVHKEKNTARIGVVAMDSYGNLLQAFGTPIQYVGKAITAEAIAIRMSLENAREMGWTKVQILSDEKNVADMVLRRTIVSWEIETTCEDSWNLMKCFEVVNVTL